jgi:probable rRNA maturation factor
MRLKKSKLHSWTERALKEAQKSPTLRNRIKVAPPWSVEAHWASSEEIRNLNRKFLGKNRATDVLSFPSPAWEMCAPGFLGELFVCAEELSVQASERELSEEQELAILVTHGVLHLLGWDHERSRLEARQMASWEKRLLQRMLPRAWVRQTQGRCLQGLIERIETSIKRK